MNISIELVSADIAEQSCRKITLNLPEYFGLPEWNEQYARIHGAKTMTVETLSPSESDENYLKTYRFYERMGFAPLFNLKPNGYEWSMVYMCLVLA